MAFNMTSDVNKMVAHYKCLLKWLIFISIKSLRKNKRHIISYNTKIYSVLIFPKYDTFGITQGKQLLLKSNYPLV